MHYAWKRPLENLPEEMTEVWSCTNESCNGWVRADFSFQSVPSCFLCKSVMTNSSKVLPILLSSDHQLKQLQKKQKAAPSV